MTVVERWWQVRRADKRTHWTPEDPHALIAAGKAPAWEGALIIGPYVPEADYQGAVAIIRALVAVNDTHDGAIGDLRSALGDEAADQLRAILGGQ